MLNLLNSINIKEFNTFTKNHAEKATYPEIWQRPSGKKRIGSIVSWLNEDIDRTMPDAIILGERRKEFIQLQAVAKMDNVFTLSIKHELKSKCKSCGDFLDKEGNLILAGIVHKGIFVLSKNVNHVQGIIIACGNLTRFWC